MAGGGKRGQCRPFDERGRGTRTGRCICGHRRRTGLGAGWSVGAVHAALGVLRVAWRRMGHSSVGWPTTSAPEESGTLPCHILWPTAPLYPSRNGKPRCAHLAMLGLLGEARGHRLHFWHLGIEMWRFCIAVGITTLFIEVTPRVLPLYQYLGWPLTICGDTLLHWGEECYLCTMELPDVAQTLLRRAQNSRHYHRIIAQAFRLESEFKLAA